MTGEQIRKSLDDVIESILQGYGAGTIGFDGYTVYPGFWSLYGKEEKEGHFLIDVEHEDGLNQYQIAGAVMDFAKTYKRPEGVAAIERPTP